MATGIIICPKCKGSGFRDNRRPRLNSMRCRKCDGAGKLGAVAEVKLSGEWVPVEVFTCEGTFLQWRALTLGLMGYAGPGYWRVTEC